MIPKEQKKEKREKNDWISEVLFAAVERGGVAVVYTVLCLYTLRLYSTLLSSDDSLLSSLPYSLPPLLYSTLCSTLPTRPL